VRRVRGGLVHRQNLLSRVWRVTMKYLRWLINIIWYGILIGAGILLAVSLLKIADFILGA
jgi:prolipoprotein diacylglyceryltransferase